MATVVSERPPRPVPLSVNADAIPDLLKELPQWVNFQYKFNPAKNEWRKFPISPRTGGTASDTDPTTWVTFRRALAYSADNNLDGIWFTLTREAGIIAVDLDKCVQNGVPDRWAAALVRRFDSYAEYSPSGAGIHIFVTGELPPGRRKRHPVEIYGDTRFMSVTGQRLDGAPDDLRDAPDAVTWLLAKMGPPTPGAVDTPIVRVPVDNLHARLERAPIRPETLDLLEYPGNGKYPSASEADSAIACALIGAGFSSGEVLSIIEDSPRGRAALLRKGEKHGRYYWRTTVAHAAAYTTPRAVCGIPTVFPKYRAPNFGN